MKRIFLVPVLFAASCSYGMDKNNHESNKEKRHHSEIVIRRRPSVGQVGSEPSRLSLDALKSSEPLKRSPRLSAESRSRSAFISIKEDLKDPSLSPRASSPSQSPRSPRKLSLPRLDVLSKHSSSDPYSEKEEFSSDALSNRSTSSDPLPIRRHNSNTRPRRPSEDELRALQLGHSPEFEHEENIIKNGCVKKMIALQQGKSIVLQQDKVMVIQDGKLIECKTNS